MNRNEAEERVPEEKGKITNMISRSLDYISDHNMEDIKIENLAKSCHISETHFRRLFTSYMKVSPLEYINTVRIQTACDLLQKYCLLLLETVVWNKYAGSFFLLFRIVQKFPKKSLYIDKQILPLAKISRITVSCMWKIRRKD